MADFRIDIVLPVWNRPVDTRSTLVSLIACTPGARFILVDNGSDRETELILHEFAEGLGDGALLIRSERNEGVIPAINRGLERSELPYVAVVSPGTVVTEGWCDTLLMLMDQQSDLGAALPPHGGGTSKGGELRTVETAAISLGAMVLRRGALESCGLLDPDLDGDRWCLQDYACRLHAGDWRIVVSAGPPVQRATPMLFGSESRRRALTETSRETVESRWGTDRTFCLQAGATAPQELVPGRMAVLLEAARQGHRLTVLLTAKVYDALSRADGLPVHGGIRFIRLPRLFPQRAASATVSALMAAAPDVIFVNLGTNPSGQGGGDEITFDGFAEMIAQRRQCKFGRY